MTYRDMTFCTFYKDCAKADKCHRPLTPEVIADAEKWMENVPICCFAEKPSCHERKEA